MRFLIVGCGSIGRRHLGNLKALSAGRLMAYDSNDEKRHNAERDHGATAFSDFEEALAQAPDAVLVCTPPSSHTQYALAALRGNCHVFVEKPLSDSVEGLDEVVSLASSRDRRLLVGCNFRFHWGMRLVRQLIEEGRTGKVLFARAEFGQYLPDWHPREDYRKGYSAQKALGGGIILDSIHELDYLHWLFGEVNEVCCMADKLSNLKIDVEDVAEITVRFANGVVAQIHVDYLQRAYHRSLKIAGEEGVLIWSFQDDSVALYSAEERSWRSFGGESPGDVNDMYVEEMKHFIRCLEGVEKPLVDAGQGKYVLDIALAAKTSAERGTTVCLEA